MYTKILKIFICFPNLHNRNIPITDRMALESRYRSTSCINILWNHIVDGRKPVLLVVHPTLKAGYLIQSNLAHEFFHQQLQSNCSKVQQNWLPHLTSRSSQSAANNTLGWPSFPLCGCFGRSCAKFDIDINCLHESWVVSRVKNPVVW